MANCEFFVLAVISEVYEGVVVDVVGQEGSTVLEFLPSEVEFLLSEGDLQQFRQPFLQN